jgi:hypothetical protein
MFEEIEDEIAVINTSAKFSFTLCKTDEKILTPYAGLH